MRIFRFPEALNRSLLLLYIPLFPPLLKADETAYPAGFICFAPPTISFFKRLFGSFAAPTPAVMSAAKDRAQALIDNNAVVVFSKSYCPYCHSSKKLLKDLGANFELLELDQDSKLL